MSFGPILDAALAAQAACESIRLKNCVIGGIALQRWGEPRFTADADLSVLVEPGEEAQVAKELLQRLPARIADARVCIAIPCRPGSNPRWSGNRYSFCRLALRGPRH